MVPLIIKDTLKWELLNWDLVKWKEILGKENLKFRKGYILNTKEPQFENSTNVIHLTFDQFLAKIEQSDNEWLYFDYKYLRSWFVDLPELRKHISWDAFGFSDCNVDDSTFWLGSKGAHTPCHQDTYGCNIVAQVYGRKRWMLFPPRENLQPTRIPYEESSIYSKINMFNASPSNFKDITECKSIILNPGDVLVVPHKWWHYVENLELSISINLWIELPVDHEERVNESIVQMLISQLSQGLPRQCLSLLLNPESNLDGINFIDAINLTHTCIQRYKDNDEHFRKINLDELLMKFKNISIIKSLSSEQFTQLLEQDKKEEFKAKTVDNESKLIKDYLDAVLHEDVVNSIKNKLLQIL
ncbi:hypothetical protein FQA39_LY03321 [Lamprigera yunnana]|nr:hypothetical protein FQA39_LY03321 [Lamprigera yunnana]